MLQSGGLVSRTLVQHRERCLPVIPAASRHQHTFRSRLPVVRPTRLAAAWDEDSTTLSDLKRQLDEALQAVTDSSPCGVCRMKSTNGRLGIEDANLQFYDAFRNGNYEAMARVWGNGDHVQVVHPGSNIIVGREEVTGMNGHHVQVLESWKSILRHIKPRAFKINVEDVRVFATDGFGYVTCVEIMTGDDSTGRIVATNVFEKQGGRWVMTLHQGGPAPPLPRSL